MINSNPKIQKMVQNFLNGKETYKSINANEAVAFRAAVLAAILTNVNDENIEKLIFIDVTTLSLAIETAGGVTTVLIPRYSIHPTKKTQILFQLTQIVKGMCGVNFREQQILTHSFSIMSLICFDPAIISSSFIKFSKVSSILIEYMILKMDIESYEWEVFQYLPINNMRQFKYIVGEFHFFSSSNVQ